jgi:hypothetical protein
VFLVSALEHVDSEKNSTCIRSKNVSECVPRTEKPENSHKKFEKLSILAHFDQF